MKTFIFPLLLLALSLASCSDDDNETQNPLLGTGLIGEWEISAKGINNVSSLEALCCETINFTDDSLNSDMRGNYSFNDTSGLITNGTFIIDTNNNVILYTTESNNSYSQEYLLDANILEVWYFEDENRYWTQYSR